MTMTMKGPLLLYLPSLLFTVVVILGVGVSIGSVSAQNLRTKTIHLRDRLNEKQEKELLRLLKVDPNGKEQKIVSGFETDETLSWQVQFGDNVCGKRSNSVTSHMGDTKPHSTDLLLSNIHINILIVIIGATLIRDDIVLTAAHCINNAGCVSG